MSQTISKPLILGIESSCDETSAAVLFGGKVRSNIISSQIEHGEYGGVIPELASRLHQQQIIRVVSIALKKAGVDKHDLDAIAFTRGPGLLGALMVGTCFAKTFALGLDIPLIEVNHMQAHVLSNFLQDPPPQFPFLCLTVSGGHTQLVLVRDHLDMEVIGQSIDDAAGEAFDKAAKLMGLPYPGGPQIDRYAKLGKNDIFSFPTPKVDKLAFSFSGLKTSLLYLLRDEMKKDPDFIRDNMADLCASYQHRIIRILIDKVAYAARKTGVIDIALAGGVSANSELRSAFKDLSVNEGWNAFIPPFEYCTDNAAMIGIAGHFKYLQSQFTSLYTIPFARVEKTKK